jgi:DNA gyrase subunit B
VEFDPETIRSRLRELAFLNSAATIQYRAGKGEGSEEWNTYHFSGGLKEFVSWTNRDREVMHDPIYITKEVPSPLTPFEQAWHPFPSLGLDLKQ